jgi:hypothetical protein
MSPKVTPPDTSLAAVSGSKLFKACNYDHRLCGAVIARQSNWKELLDTIDSGQFQRNVAMIVWQIREALGKDCEHAGEIMEG